MAQSNHTRQCYTSHPRRRRSSWCCSFAVQPSSPENRAFTEPAFRKNKKPDSSVSKHGPYSVPNSPKPGLNFVGRIDPRRILSPGRVSPIDSDPTADTIRDIIPDPSPPVDLNSKSRSESFRGRSGRRSFSDTGSDSGRGVFDVRLNLRGKNGGGLVLELNSEVLIENSEVFAGLICEYRKNLGSKCNRNEDGGNLSRKICRIEVPDVENLGIFRDTIELMFEEDIAKRLLKIGAYRAIDILEVSAGIMFTKGVLSCLKYLEAVPWTEEEEDKLRNLFTVFKFDETTTRDILARLDLLSSESSQENLAKQLVWSITTCADADARNELKSLVKGLLCRSSVYEKDQHDLTKEDLYDVCHSCLGSLVSLMKEASDNIPQGTAVKKDTGKPLIGRISRQVDNIIWLLEILLDRQIGEEFVGMWADQVDLLKMHESTSPMVRYELSRVSAILFIAMGTRKLHCRSEARAVLLQAWFGPMLLDFGWLQRCKKGLDMKALEEAMGQTLLTLPMKQQYKLFTEWFGYFSKHGTECPNLSKSFQIWWRRSFLRGSETHAIESSNSSSMPIRRGGRASFFAMATHLREYLRCSLFALLTHLKKKRKKNDGLWFMGPSAGSSTTLTLASSQPNPSSPFSCLTKSSSNNPQSSHNMLAASTAINHVSSAHSPAQTPMQQSSQSNEVDPNEFQSSVEKIIQEMMNSSQFSGAGGVVSVDYEGDDIKDINRGLPTPTGGFGSLNGQNHLSASTSRFTAAMGNVSRKI